MLACKPGSLNSNPRVGINFRGFYSYKSIFYFQLEKPSDIKIEMPSHKILAIKLLEGMAKWS